MGEDLVVTQPGDGPSLCVIGVQQTRLAAARENCSEFPGQIVRITNPGVCTVSAAVGWELMCGVTDEEDPPAAEVICDERRQLPATCGDEVDGQVVDSGGAADRVALLLVAAVAVVIEHQDPATVGVSRQKRVESVLLDLELHDAVTQMLFEFRRAKQDAATDRQQSSAGPADAQCVPDRAVGPICRDQIIGPDVILAAVVPPAQRDGHSIFVVLEGDELSTQPQVCAEF